MPSTLLQQALVRDFTGFTQLQAQEVSHAPTVNGGFGVPGSMRMVDGWGEFTIHEEEEPTFSGIRSEGLFSADTVGQEYTYAWRGMVPSEKDAWEYNTGRIILGQMHTHDSIVAAVNFAWWVIGEELIFSVPKDIPSLTFGERRFPVGKLQYDTPYDFMVHAVWSNTGAGMLEATLNGRQVFKENNIHTAYASDAPYFKLGVYDGPHLADFGRKTARFQNVRRYSGFAGYSDILLPPGVPQPMPRRVQ